MNSNLLMEQGEVLAALELILQDLIYGVAHENTGQQNRERLRRVIQNQVKTKLPCEWSVRPMTCEHSHEIALAVLEIARYATNLTEVSSLGALALWTCLMTSTIG